jgi:hypothetical protein
MSMRVESASLLDISSNSPPNPSTTPAVTSG